MIHPSGLDGMSLPIIKHWDIMDTHSNLLVSNATIGPISGNPPLMAGAQPGSEYIFTWLRQISENSIIFGVRQPGTQQSPVLYSLDLEKGQLEKIIDLPVETLSILWSLDGEGTLVRGEDALLLYIAFRNGDLFDLRPILGTGADDFTWLPPAPRQ